MKRLLLLNGQKSASPKNHLKIMRKLNKLDTSGKVMSELLNIIKNLSIITINNFILYGLCLLAFLSLITVKGKAFFICMKIMIVFSILKHFLIQKKLDMQSFITLLCSCIIVIPGLYGVIYGLNVNNPGARSELALFVFAPISYLIIFYNVANISKIAQYFKFTIKLAIILNLCVFYYLYFSEFGLIHEFLAKATSFIIQNPQGYKKVFSLQIVPLIFMLPVMAVYYFNNQSKINFLLLNLLILMTIMSGRKSLIILFFLVSITFISLNCFRHRNWSLSFKLIAPLVISPMLFFLYFQNDTISFLKDTFIYSWGVNKKTNLLNADDIKKLNSDFPSSSSFMHLYKSTENICSIENSIYFGIEKSKLGGLIRRAQINCLTKEIASSPFFGNGLGCVIKQCVRSESQPWRFELTYLGIIMNIGLIGFAVYIGVYLFWFRKVVYNGESTRDVMPLLCGSAFFIICSATNPYIMGVENLWIYFVPYMLVNASEAASRKSPFPI